MKYFLLLSEKQTFIVACLFFWLLGKFQTAISCLELFFFLKKIKMSQKISVSVVFNVSEPTLTSPGQCRFADLPVTNVLLHFIRPFVPAKEQ